MSPDRFELFIIDSKDPNVSLEFDQYLVNQKVYNLLILRQDANIKLPTNYPYEIMYFHNKIDVTFDHFGRYLNDFTQKRIDHAFIQTFIHSTTYILLSLNQSIFEEMCMNLSQYKSEYLYIYTTYNYYYRKMGKTSERNMLKISITNNTVMFVMDLFTYLFQTTFWMTWNDAAHIIQNTTYGQSDKCHLILKNGWNKFEELAKQSVNEILPYFIQLIKNRHLLPHTMKDVEHLNYINSRFVSFINIFNIIKERLEVSKNIFDWKHSSNANHGVVGWSLYGNLVPLSLEYRILKYLGYEYSSIRTSNVNVKRTPKSRKFTIKPLSSKDLPDSPKNISVKNKKQRENLMSSSMMNAVLNGTDIIKIYEVAPEHIAPFEQHLISRNKNDLLVIIFDNANEIDQHRIKYFANTIDKLFESIVHFLKVPTAETAEWVDTVISKICEYEATFNTNSVFIGMYKTLDLMISNKTKSQQMFVKYIKNRYVTCNYKLHRMESIAMLTSSTMQIEDIRHLFSDGGVMKMVLQFFRMSLLNAYNLKYQDAMETLQRCEWVKHFNSSLLMDEAIWFDHALKGTVDKFMDAAMANTSDENVDELETIVGDLFFVCSSLAGWKMQIDIADTIYEFKYVEHRLDKDVSVEMVESKYSFLLHDVLQSMGYTDDRIRQYNVSATMQKKKKQQNQQMVFKSEIVK